MKQVEAILLIGACGSGKTWVMRNIINDYNLKISGKYGLIKFKTNEKICVGGKYDGSMFEGSDKLSMAISKDFLKFFNFLKAKKWKIICEGDRFTNSKFIKIFQPLIIKIKDNGKSGRLKRKSKQSERHLKCIQTRVNNLIADKEVENSNDAFSLIKEILNENNNSK